MASFVQNLFVGSAPGPDSILVLTGSKTITAGNDIYVLLATDNTNSDATCVDNLGNTYALVHRFDGPAESLTNSCQHLFHAVVTAGGTLTSQTLDWTNGSGIGSGAGSIEFTDAVTPAQTATNQNGSGTSADLTIGTVAGVLLFTQAIYHVGGLSGYTPPTGYTNSFIGDGGGAKAVLDYKVGTATGTLSSSWTTSAEWTVVHTDIAGTEVFRPQIIRYARR